VESSLTFSSKERMVSGSPFHTCGMRLLSEC
jgi:hypothetical protein